MKNLIFAVVIVLLGLWIGQINAWTDIRLDKELGEYPSTGWVVARW